MAEGASVERGWQGSSSLSRWHPLEERMHTCVWTPEPWDLGLSWESEPNDIKGEEQSRLRLCVQLAGSLLVLALM